MNERTHYRLTGSLLLVAVVAIFLPMLFDGEDVASVELVPVQEDYSPPSSTALDFNFPQSDVAALAQELREQIDSEGIHRETRTKIGEPVLSEPDENTDAWAVQVGSFEDGENARAFRDQLRADGKEAFTSAYRFEDRRILTRVAVGPLRSAERANQFVEDLSARYEVEARLVAYGN